VAEALVALTGPFREKLEAIKADKKDAKQKIKASSAVIRERAQETLREVKEIAGLLS
jgi:tryptophanyl-tRNA synthetase